MKKWKENKGFILITSLATLVPAVAGTLLWQKLPDTMATHFGRGNVPNGWSSKGFTVFGLPLFMLVIHLLCGFATAQDPKQNGISNKVYRLILLICPVISLLCGVTIYGYALNISVNIGLIAEVFVGLLLIVIGNYLPKCRQNFTVGIKLPWTLADEENWNHTHRLAGFVWMLCGVFFVLNAFFNIGGALVFFGVFAVMIIIPTGYSLIYYINHKG